MFLPRGFGLVIVLPALAGCYRFVPVATPEPLPGTHVAAALTDAGSSELAQYLGLNIANVGGRLVRSSPEDLQISVLDRKSTRLNSSHGYISYAVFCLKKKKN